jgi:hypothetical protein
MPKQLSFVDLTDRSVDGADGRAPLCIVDVGGLYLTFVIGLRFIVVHVAFDEISSGFAIPMLTHNAGWLLKHLFGVLPRRGRRVMGKAAFRENPLQ